MIDKSLKYTNPLLYGFLKGMSLEIKRSKRQSMVIDAQWWKYADKPKSLPAPKPAMKD